MHIERTDQPTPEPETPPYQGMPAYPRTPASGETPQVIVMQTPPRQQRSGCRSCLPTLIIIALVAVPLLIGLLSVTQVGHVFKALISGDVPAALTAIPVVNERIRVGESAILVPSSNDMPPDIIALSTHYSTNSDKYEDRLIALKSDTPTLRWQSAGLGDTTYRTPLLADADRVYTLREAELIALDRDDGSTDWKITLPDVVAFTLCQNCIQVWDDTMFTLSDDGTLLATDTLTGEALWDYRANEDSPRGLYIFDGRVAFMDRDENNKGILRLFDPQTGDMDILQPVCNIDNSPDYADWTTPLYPTADGNSFYIIFGYGDACAQRWDVTTGTPTWSAAIPRLPHTISLLDAGQTLYIGNDGFITALDAETGNMRTLIEDEDYDFVPLEATSSGLLVRATRQRGSTRFEIRLVDSNDGSTNWTFDLGDNPPLDPPDEAHSIIDEDKPVWTWHMLSDTQLLILRVKCAEDDKSHALLWDIVDMQTGQSDGTQEQKLGISTIILSAPEFRIWQRNILWMSIEGELLGFDAEAGKLIYRWP